MRNADLISKILIVDDSEKNLQAMKTMLEDPAYEIETTKSGESALRLVLKHDFALILLDVRMPTMDGFETARYITSREKTRNTPIIFLTAFGQDEVDIHRGYSLGAADFLVKPISKEVLRSKVAIFSELHCKNILLKNQEESLRLSKDQLEIQVQERTGDLLQTTKNLELEIHEREKADALSKQYGAIIESSDDAIISKTLAGTISSWNLGAEKVYGYSYREVIGKPMLILCPQDRYDEEPQILKRIGRGEKINHFETVRVRKDGSEIDISMTISPIKDNAGNIVGASSIARDITERKKAEAKIHQSLEEKVILLKEVHHRVKNNLQIISSILSLQLTYTQDPLVVKTFQELQSRIHSIAMIHELLCQSGNLEQIEFDQYLKELVGNLRNTYSGRLKNVNILVEAESLQMNIDSAIHCGLLVNELLTNAMKYAFPDQTQGQIRVKMTRQSDFFSLVVADDGQGLPPELDVKDPESLGFQLVNILAKQLEGDLVLERHPGTVFSLRFPAFHSGTVQGAA